MSKPTEKVTVILSHNQEVAGKAHKAGDEVEVNSRLARVLQSRGSAQTKAAADAATAAKDTSSATLTELHALAEQRGVNLGGASRKADIQAALDAAPETPAATAEKGGKR